MPKIKLPKINFENIRKIFNRYSFLLFAVGLLIVIAVNAFIFYKFAYLPLNGEPERSFRKLELKRDILAKFQDNLNKREETLKRIESKTYRDIFNP